MDTCFAVCSPGLEPFVARELIDLGLAPSAAPQSAAGQAEDSGGIEFPADLPGIYRANLHLRCASRVLVRLGEFYAAAFPELRKKAARLPWERYLRPGQPVVVRATCHKSRLYHSDGVAERVMGAIGDRVGAPPPPGKYDEAGQAPPPQLVVVRLAHDKALISIDSSGALLYRRGYRQAVAKAPLRETLAAGMLLASGWDPAAPLLDPFCGSGTIAIEAALLAARLAPGRSRRFAFQDWPTWDAPAWARLLDEAGQAAAGAAPVRIQASDRDAGAIEMARANAERAGVLPLIEFTRQAVSAIQPPPGPGWVITNPPYGLRVSARQDLRNLYAQFGNVLRLKCPGWRVAVLCNDLLLLSQTRLRLESSLALVNGGLAVRLGRGAV
ncbi:MAG: class I SAM-dependent RNA methyltransferase [Chloroflexota bacterium]